MCSPRGIKVFTWCVSVAGWSTLLLVDGVLDVSPVWEEVAGASPLQPGLAKLGRLCSISLSHTVGSLIEQTDSLLVNCFTVTVLPSSLHFRITGVPRDLRDVELVWSLESEFEDTEMMAEEPATSGTGEETDLEREHLAGLVHWSWSEVLSISSSSVLGLLGLKLWPEEQTSTGSAIPSTVPECAIGSPLLEDMTVGSGVLAQEPEVREADLIRPADAGCMLITEVQVTLN